ncbi:GH3 auxin-responsive promoter family protein [Myroides sp. LJL119]
MAFTIINSIASWILKKRIHQIDLFRTHPNQVQQELFFNLIKTNEKTLIGKQYDYASIKNYETFSQRVPLFKYEEFEPYIERCRQGENNIFWPEPVRYFAKSSGTTNAKSKFIPVSQQALEDCHYKAAKDLLCLYLNNNPESQLFTGKGLRLGGSKQLYQDNNTFFGDLSAILIDNAPFWAELSSTPSNKTSLMSEWESKMDAIIKEVRNENVTSIAGVPSWMLVLFNRIIAETGKDNLLELWPNAEVYFHGGVSFEPYKEQYQRLFPSNQMKYYEIYNASEGFFAIQDQNNCNELLLMLDYGIFYEFIPMDSYGSENQRIIDLSQVELDKNYAMVITTNAGLIRYEIGDTVRFTSLLPYRIKITGRTKHFINVFGEELMIENTDRALAKTCSEFDVNVVEYTVGPIFMQGKEKGAHQWLIEFSKQPLDLDLFSQVLDKNLQELNSDYEAKRTNNMTLNPLRLVSVRRNLFYDWLKQNDKLGGQHKIPRLSNERKIIDQLLKMQELQVV